MKSKSKLDIAITFGVVFLMRSLENLILTSYTWIPYTTIEGTMKGNERKKEKKPQFKQQSATTFGHLTQKHYGFNILKHCYVHLTVLAP